MDLNEEEEQVLHEFDVFFADWLAKYKDLPECEPLKIKLLEAQRVADVLRGKDTSKLPDVG